VSPASKWPGFFQWTRNLKIKKTGSFDSDFVAPLQHFSVTTDSSKPLMLLGYRRAH
jgi:hypothetical protein